MNNTDEIKKNLRTEFKNLRRNMDTHNKDKLDEHIYRNLLECSVFQNAGSILIYKSTEIEVSTERIIRYCIDNKIKTALPKCFGKGKMKFFRYDGNEDKLEKSVYGIYEPNENHAPEVKTFENTVCIVPALAIDNDGYRLGYGGGYYDRFLAEHEEIISVVLCYCENITDRLVHNKFDRKAAFAVTEKGLEVY